MNESVYTAANRVKRYLDLRDEVRGKGVLTEHVSQMFVNGREGTLTESDLRALLLVMEGYRQLGRRPLAVILRALAEYRDYVEVLDWDEDFDCEPFRLEEVERTIEAVAAYCGEQVPERMST